MRPLLLLLILPLVLLAALGAAWFLAPERSPEWREVPVETGDVVRHAVAVGRLEPRFEIPVTATHGGVVTRLFVQAGDRVAEGDPLVEVRPVLTDAQRLAAERALVAAREAEADARELSAGENIMGGFMLALQGEDSVERMRKAAERARSTAEEQLTLLLEGRVEVEGRVIDWIVRAPSAGDVLQLDAEIGMPVVPASQYGPGTALCILGDLADPVFRGTVDEGDAGALREGMPAEVTLGALPDATLEGVLEEISLLGEREDNAVSFPVEIAVDVPPDLVVRAGYSAVARIVVERAVHVPVVPERLLRFDGEDAEVRVRGADGEPQWRTVELGLADGLVAEVRGGVQPGDVLLERSE